VTRSLSINKRDEKLAKTTVGLNNLKSHHSPELDIKQKSKDSTPEKIHLVKRVRGIRKSEVLYQSEPQGSY
jgi:hypothetical protein